MRNTKREKITKNDITSYIFLLPWFVVLIVFNLYPFVEGIRTALYEFTLRKKSFIGLANFVTLFSDKAFWNAMLITFKMVVWIAPGTMIASLAVAYAIQTLSTG